MGFKIRDKSLFYTKNGWKNNWEPKIVNMPRAINPTDTSFLISRQDHHSFLRMYQSYRNYSRICRQYFYGDKHMEQALTLELRHAFRIPYECETPVDLIKHGAERRMADQLDRQYELLSHNYHPIQLQAYELQNARIRAENQEYEAKERGEETMSDAIAKAFEDQIEAMQKKLAPGQKLSLEQLSDIYFKVSKALRAHTGVSEQARGEDGEFNDFLEKRRPFVDADNERVSH